MIIYYVIYVFINVHEVYFAKCICKVHEAVDVERNYAI